MTTDWRTAQAEFGSLMAPVRGQNELARARQWGGDQMAYQTQLARQEYGRQMAMSQAQQYQTMAQQMPAAAWQTAAPALRNDFVQRVGNFHPQAAAAIPDFSNPANLQQLASEIQGGGVTSQANYAPLQTALQNRPMIAQPDSPSAGFGSAASGVQQPAPAGAQPGAYGVTSNAQQPGAVDASNFAAAMQPGSPWTAGVSGAQMQPWLVGAPTGLQTGPTLWAPNGSGAQMQSAYATQATGQPSALGSAWPAQPYAPQTAMASGDVSSGYGSALGQASGGGLGAGFGGAQGPGATTNQQSMQAAQMAAYAKP